jgi:RHS repeat-associated protein
MTNPAREVHYSWNRAGLLETVTANLSGTIPLFRRNGGSAVAPTPPDASVDGPVTLATMSYDTFGNLSRTITPNGRCSDIAYDLAYQQLPVVHRAGCETANALVTASEFDRGLGAVVKETSPDTTVRGAQYDGFGRLIEIDQPDALTPGKISPFPSTTIDWTLADKGPISKVHSRSISGSGPAPEYAESWTYLDSLGNLLATVSKDGITDQWIVTGLAARAVNGRILRLFEAQSLPGKDGSAFQLTAPPLAASITYDALGRRLSATGVDGFTTTFKQLPTEFSVEVQDPEQQPGGGHSGSFTTLKSDVFGRHVATIRHFANDPQQVITTTMEYEASGELLRVFRAVEGGGPPIRQEHFYDSFGRRVRTIELNTLDGDAPQSWAYAYNDNGDLMGTSDAMGCGENFFYDNLGRLLAEDYSPCSPEQTPYSPPNFSTGEGIEKFNVYDGPATPTGTPSDAVYRGHLTQTFDLAQKSDIVLDARGRAVLLRRQMSLPGARSNAFALRYAPRVYEQQVLAFDEANRPLTRTTRAETPELRPPNVGSWIAANYDLRGAVHSVTSSYGDLITEQEFNSAGSLTRRVMGDAAGTVLSAGYDDARIIKSFKIARRPGPWLPAGPTYVPPDPGSANTVQGVLTDLSFNKYDRVRNALEIAEAAPAADWPPGARPALQTSAQYDDAYRLRQVNRRYSSPEAAASDDVAISPLANEVGKGAFPVVETAANRIRKETFDYDWMGNVTAADDDAHLFDRSTGAVSLTPNHPHRVASLKQGNVSATVSYDTAGHVTRVELTRDKPCTARCPVLYSYHWDELGRLAGGSRTDAIPGIDKPQVEAEISYVYGGDGQRVLKALGPAKFLGELRFSINIFDTLSLERTSFDPAAGDYVRDARSERVHLSSPTGMLGLASLQAPDVPSGSAGRTRVFLALPDLLGSPAFMIDRETSELVEHATFEAAGIAEADFRPDRWGNFRYQYRHTGHSDDIEIGLVNFGARYYAPMLGRWLSPDPLTVHAMAGDMNPYRFVRGSPLRLVDPVGLDDCDVLTPGCGGFSETFPGDPDAGSGPVAGIGPGSGPSGASHGSGGASPPRPPVPGPVKAFDSPAGMLALVTGQPNVQVDLPGGYFVNTDRFGIAVINTLSSTLAHLPSTIPSNNPLLEKVLPVLEKQAEDMLRIQNETTETKDVSVLAGAITALSAMALVPVGGEEAELANLPIAWEEIAPTWHHIFPQAKEFAKFWERAGIDIHEYLALLPRDIHLEQLHGPGNPPIPGAGARGGIWNANWREFFAPFEKTGTYPTREEIFNQARIMLKGFDVYSFHPSTFRVPLPPRPTR